MNLLLQRINDNGESTIGYLSYMGKFLCFTLEDEFRKVKVKGDTRIPAGSYRLAFRNELTPLTKKYQQKFDWFNFHIQIQDVPNFNYVYLHLGNLDDHTDGCVLLGKGCQSYDNEQRITDSTSAFKEFYQAFKGWALENDNVWLTIQDEPEAFDIA